MEVTLAKESAALLAELIAEKICGARNKPEPYVSLREASKHFNIPTGTLYKMTSQNKIKIPHVKKGKLLFKISEVEKWLKNRE